MLPESGYDKHQCAYAFNGERCRYPGTLSPTTLGEGPWYCRWHWQCESGVIGERVVAESRNYRMPDAAGYRHPLVNAIAAAYRKPTREPGEDRDEQDLPAV